MVATTTAYRTQMGLMGCYQSGPRYRKKPRNSADLRHFRHFGTDSHCIKHCVLIDMRVASGGHFVETEKVIERYYKSINNIKRLIEICDIMHVYDNTKRPTRIIRKHKEALSIYPNEYWNEETLLKLIL